MRACVSNAALDAVENNGTVKRKIHICKVILT
jgi:hypothetical protein